MSLMAATRSINGLRDRTDCYADGDQIKAVKSVLDDEIEDNKL